MKNNLLTTTALTCAVGFAAAGLTAAGFAGKAAGGTDVGNGYVGVGASIVGHDGCKDDTDEPGDDDCSDERISGTDTGFKAFAGYRFHRYGAVEGAYHFFGEAQSTGDEFIESQGVSLALLGILPVTSDGTGSVFLRAGGIYGWIDNDENTDIEREASGFSPIAGIGAMFDLSDRLSVRGEVEYVNNIGDGEGSESTTGHVDVLSFTVGALWRF